MFRVARQTDYAVRIILHLARLGDGMTTIARITQQDRLPNSFVRRLVARLEKGGLVVTLRGKKGGVRLARPAGQISLLDVVQVMERRLDPGNGPQAGPGGSPLKEAWRGAARTLATSLAAIRFDHIVGEPGADGPEAGFCNRRLPAGF